MYVKKKKGKNKKKEKRKSNFSENELKIDEEKITKFLSLLKKKIQLIHVLMT